MKNLKRILIIRYAVLIAAVLLAVSLVVIIPLRSFTISQEKDRLEDNARLLATEYRRFFSEETPSSTIDLYLEDLAGGIPLRITLIDDTGRVLGDSEAQAAQMENHANRPEIAAALEGRVESSTRESRTLGKNFIYAAAPISVKGEIVGVARASVAEEDVMPLVYQLWWIILGAFGLMVVVVIVVSVWTERTIMRSLGGLRDASTSLAAGDLAWRVSEPDIKDFGELARGFNIMTERIRGMVAEAAEEKSKLKAVLNNISAGIMVTDTDRKIILLNPAAVAILGIEEDEADGRRVIEVFPSSKLDEAVSDATEGKSVDKEIELLHPQKAYLHIKSNPVAGSAGNVVATVSVIEDITTLKQLNLIRQDFVANVSHELRTPVASIKALTDSLQAGARADQETAGQFIRDLDQEATRLSQLIVDLLTLSKLEAREAVLKTEEISVKALVDECQDDKRSLVEEYGVTLEVDLESPEATVTGDHQLLRTAINNLIDNAIKYNHPEGIVTIAQRKEDGGYSFEVSDTGIGIPHEELPRIFERFYRVDKARSRETGGTGLGLSIVKHIAELHGGLVSVRSAEGEGSSFTIHLPGR